MKPRFNPFFRTLAIVAGLHQAAFSANLYWDGSSTDWGTATAWSESASATTPDPAASPAAGDMAIFSATTVLAAADVQLAADQAAQGLTFNLATLGATLKSSSTTSRALAIGTDGITIADNTGNVTIGNGTNPLTINLAAPQIWNVGALRTLTVTNAITGANLFTKTGAGTLSLNAASSHTGGITLSAGLLSLGNAGALGSATGAFTISGGSLQNASTTAALNINVNKPVVLSGNFTYVVPTGGNGNLGLGAGGATLTANVTVTSATGLLTINGGTGDGGGNFGITKTGQATLALLGTNTYTGQTNLIGSGNLRVSGPEGIANTPVYLNGGVLEVGGSITNLNLGPGPGQIRWNTNTNGGLSTDTGYRQLSINSNAPLAWGVTPNFINGANAIFILSTAQSSGTIDLTNDIDLGNADRRFSIRDSTVVGAPDAVLSGIISNGRISLQGGGVLAVMNPASTLSGAMTLTAGGVRVPSFAPFLTNSHPVLTGGAVIEVGDNSTIPLGAANGQVAFGTPAPTGGFSAYGTSRSITLLDTVTSSTSLVWGTGAFVPLGSFYLSSSSSDTTTTLTNNIDLNGATRTIQTANGSAPVDAALPGLISGVGGGLTFTGAGAALTNAANSYTGPTTLGSGSLNVTKLANGGVNSSIGASGSEATNLMLTGTLRYVGTGDSTDRLFTHTSTLAVLHNGTGPLIFTNPGTYAVNGAAARTVSLGGISLSPGELHGALSDGTGAAVVNLVKTGQTPWTLGGTNLFTGLTSVNNGILTFDYSQGGVPLNPAQTGTTNGITLENGHVTIKGAPSGTTTVPLSNLRLANGNLGINSILTLNSNGGDGIALTIGSLNFNPNAPTSTQNTYLIDKSSSAANSITVNSLANANIAATISGPSESLVTSYLLMTNATANSGRSTLVVKDSTGYGWGKLVNTDTPGTVPGTLERLTLAETNPVTETNTGATTNFSLTAAGTVTRTAAITFSTLTVDTTAGDITLDLTDKVFGNGTGNNGRGILLTGPNNFTLSGTSLLGAGYSPFIHHYGTGVFNWGLTFADGASFITGGTGFINFTGAINTGNTRTYLNGNLLRFAGGGDASASTGGFWVSNGGVIEIGSDLSASATADFSNAVGSAAGNIHFTGNSGISASGADRVVNFGGAGATLTWGANYFLTNGGNTADVDAAFKLSSSRADATVQIVNPINLNARDRVFDVANGSDTEDAILSGVISGPGSGIVKRGLGTLVLDGVNTYSGSTDVVQGILRLTKASLANASTVRIVAGGELNLPHGQTDIVGALYINGVAQADGIYDSTNFPGLLTGSGKLNVGGVVDGSSPYVQWVTANSIPDGKDEPTDDADSDGLLNLVEYAVGSNPVQATGSVLSKASSGAIQFNRAMGRTDITAFLESSLDLGTASWTTIATSTAGAAYVSNAPATITVAESAAGAGLMGVSVTDGTTPAPSKKFYRVRVTKP